MILCWTCSNEKKRQKMSIGDELLGLDESNFCDYGKNDPLLKY